MQRLNKYNKINTVIVYVLFKTYKQKALKN